MTRRGFNHPYNIIHVHITHQDRKAVAFWNALQHLTSRLPPRVAFSVRTTGLRECVCVVLVLTQGPAVRRRGQGQSI